MRKYISEKRAKGIVVFAPALGVESIFYAGVANFFNENSYHCYLIKARSETEKNRPNEWDFSYNNLISEDFREAVVQAKADYPQLPIIASGHSLGGQIALLYCSQFAESIDGLLMIATGSPYWKGFPLTNGLQIRFLSLLVPICTYFLGYFPGDKLGFGSKESKGVMRDWNRLAKRNVFDISPGDNGQKSFDYESAISMLPKPSLSIIMNGDPLAPPDAVQNITKKLPAENSKVFTQENSNGKSYTHFSWAKSTSSSLKEAVVWLDHLAN